MKLLHTSKTVTDKDGRVLTHQERTGEPLNRSVRVDGRKYEVNIRKLPADTGSLDGDAHSVPILAALIRKGQIPAGEHTIKVLDLPGDGLEERTIELGRTGEGAWQLDDDGHTTLRDGDGHLLGEHSLAERPLFRRLPATEEAAPDRSLGDPDAEPRSTGERARRHDRTVGIKHPGVPFELGLNDVRGVKMTGLAHPYDTGVMAAEMGIRIGASPEELLALAETVHERASDNADMPAMGAPVMGTFQKRPAAVMLVDGVVDGLAVEGTAYLVRGADGAGILVIGVHPKDLEDLCAPLLAQAMGAIRLDAAKTAWRRVTAKHAGLGLELPGDWTEKPLAGTRQKWVSPRRASQVLVGTLTLPEGVTSASLQEKWIAKLRASPVMKALKVSGGTEVDFAGVKMRRTLVTCDLPQEGGPLPLHLTGLSLVGSRKDGRTVEIVLLLFSIDSRPEDAERIQKSIRWSKPK